MKHLLFALFFCGTIAAAAEPAVPYGDNPAVGKYYEVNGVRLYCETYGTTGPVVLMIHGNGGSMEAFKGNIPYFAAKYRVIAVDSRAHGKSRDDGAVLNFELMADDFAALLDQLHVASADVIGWSDGGITALLMAMRHPEKVHRLVASGANLRPDASAFIPGFWEEERKQYEKDKDTVWKTAKERNDRKVFLLDWLEPNIPSAALRAVQCPALIMAGDHDLISLEHTVEIYHNLPHAALWIVPHSGHAVLKEHADEFNQKVDAFLTSPQPTMD